MTKRKIVVGITGASGAPYAKRMLSWLSERERSRGDIEVGVCLSATAAEVWALECGGDIRDEIGQRFPIWGIRDYKAPFASGSAGWHAMAIVPCSMGTCARIAHGISDTLLTRAADVMLKERRTLVVVPREMPLSVIHLENLTALARAGAIIQPAMPSFYGKTKTLEQAIDTVVGRTLDQLGLEHDLLARWGEGATSATSGTSMRPKAETVAPPAFGPPPSRRDGSLAFATVRPKEDSAPPAFAAMTSNPESAPPAFIGPPPSSVDRAAPAFVSVRPKAEPKDEEKP